MKIRLDKYISNLWFCSRKEASKIIKKWGIQVNDILIKKPETKIQTNDIITINNQNIKVLDEINIILHKPAWYVSSDIDENNYPSYKQLLKNCPYKWMIKIAWRLDVDTEWLLFLSSNWNKIHQLISPKKNKEKIYYVELEKDINDLDLKKLETWIKIDDDFITAPARSIKIDNNIEEIRKFWDFKESTLKQIPNHKYSILLAITEWKFHQVKKMINAVNNKVTYLKRLKIDKYELEDLKKWEWKII